MLALFNRRQPAHRVAARSSRRRNTRPEDAPQTTPAAFAAASSHWKVRSTTKICPHSMANPITTANAAILTATTGRSCRAGRRERRKYAERWINRSSIRRESTARISIVEAGASDPATISRASTHHAARRTACNRLEPEIVAGGLSSRSRSVGTSRCNAGQATFLASADTRSK